MTTDVLDKLEELEQSCRKRFIPIIGREKGQILRDLVLEVKPKKILEIGTASGYSGTILASKYFDLDDCEKSKECGAELLSIDFDHVSVDEANINFEKFNVNAKSVLAVGENWIKDFSRKKENENSFDIIFLDFSKKNIMRFFLSA